MRLVHIPSILTMLSAALLGGCSDSTNVAPRLSATYVLETVNGAALPSVVAAGNTGHLVRVADTLVFSANGQLDRHLTMRLVGLSTSASDTTIHSVDALRYVIDGTRLTIGTSCPANANCVGPSNGQIDAYRIDLIDYTWQGAVLHFTVR